MSVNIATPDGVGGIAIILIANDNKSLRIMSRLSVRPKPTEPALGTRSDRWAGERAAAAGIRANLAIAIPICELLGHVWLAPNNA